MTFFILFFDCQIFSAPTPQKKINYGTAKIPISLFFPCPIPMYFISLISQLVGTVNNLFSNHKVNSIACVKTKNGFNYKGHVSPPKFFYRLSQVGIQKDKI